MGIGEPDIAPEAFLESAEMRIGEIVSVAEFPEARKDVYKLEVDFGTETLQSAAGLTLYDEAELLGDRTRAEMRDRAKAWVPYRSVVTLYLWQYYVNVNSSVGDVVA